MTTSRERILKSLVLSLQKFGYPEVTAENVLTDDVYKMFALSQLKEAYAYKNHPAIKKMIDEVEGGKGD